jgi:two-component sensor histidine kinase
MIWIFNESQDRFKSMAMIHKMLYRLKDLGKKKLVSSLMRSYNLTRSVKITLDVKDVYLNIDIAIPCGLIINELVKNALKYAFPESISGEISVKVEQNGKLKIFVEDNGIGLPESVNFANTHTLGLRLVKILTKQLNGEVDLVRNGSAKFLIIV